MNLLQSIPEDKLGPVFVTLNPPFEPEKDLTAGVWAYDHPLFTEQSVECQKQLPKIQNQRGMTFVGAWTKYGFVSPIPPIILPCFNPTFVAAQRCR